MERLLAVLGLLRTLLLTLPLMYFWTILLGGLSLLISPFDVHGRRQHVMSLWWGRSILLICAVRVRVRGREIIDLARPCVFLANHRSYMDIPILFACLPGEFRTMAKASLFHVPFLGWHLRRTGHLPISGTNTRSDARRLLQAVRTLRAGTSLLVFPEAGRSMSGGLDEFKPGIFLAAIKAGVPIVPLAVLGSGHVMPRRSYHIRPGTVEIIVDEPIPTAGLTRADVNGLIERVRSRIENNLNADPQSG